MNSNTKTRFISFLLTVKPYLKFLLFFASLCVFFLGLYPISNSMYYNYSQGDVAVRDIKARVGFSVIDEKMTKASMNEALQKVPTVYDFDVLVKKSIVSKVQTSFDYQVKLQHDIELYRSRETKSGFDKNGEYCVPLLGKNESFEERKRIFNDMLEISVSNEDYKVLIKHKFADYIPRLINSIISQVLLNGVVCNRDILLSELDRGITLRNCYNNSESCVWDLKSFYGLLQAKDVVQTIGDSFIGNLDYELLNLIVDFSKRLIEPNIILNVEETDRRRELAIKTIVPQYHFVKLGEMILREGEVVEQDHLIKLKALNDKLSVDWISIVGAIIILACVLITFYTIQIKARIESEKLTNKDLIFLTAILVTTLLVVIIWTTLPSMWYFAVPSTEIHVSSRKFGMPFAVGSMIVCLVLGSEVAIPFALLCSIASCMFLPDKFEHFIYFFLSSVMAVWWVKDCRERGAIIKAGVKLGFFCIILAGTIDIYLSRCLQWDILIFDIMVAFAGGISAGIIAIGMVPLVEILFRYTTDVALLELANLDSPILRRLMLEAPGTYHHSVVVGAMVEAAAAEIGANFLLGKVCGYYHDIGKLKQPLYFVENQINCRNKHEKLSPSMSSLILIAHVKYGIEIARKHNLGDAIIDVISQHHGTSLISYFFEKAKHIRGDENISVSDFRYPGPIPQTVEAGLVMLADVVEAASRTVANPTSARIQGLVHNLVNKVFSDGQLNNCDFTLKDLNNIAKSFNKILSGIYHHRVEYQNFPQNTRKIIYNRKTTDVSAGKQQSETSLSANSKSLSDGSNSLKRLGLS